MRDITEDPAMTIQVWDRGERIPIRPTDVELLPTECHVKADGDLRDEPSFAFVCRHPGLTSAILVQVSLRMLMPAIREALALKGK